MSENTKSVEQLEADYTETSKELGLLITKGAAASKVAEARKRRRQIGEQLDEARLVAKAAEEHEAEQAKEQREADKQVARREAQQLMEQVEHLADDVRAALGDAGVAAAKLSKKARELGETAKRAGLNPRALDPMKLQTTAEGRVAEEAASAGVAKLPDGAKPKANLEGFIAQIKLFVNVQEDSKQEAA